MNQPSGARSPRFRLTRILPSATTLVAKSSTIAGAAPPGMAIAWGLVPSRRAAPPHGATFRPNTAFAQSIATCPRVRGHLGVVGEATHVPRPREADRGDAERLGLGHGQLHPAACHHLAEPAPAVERGRRRAVAHDGHRRGRVDLALAHLGRVLRDADHPVRVVAAEVGAHEKCRHPRRVPWGSAESGEDAGRRRLELGRIHGWHGPYNSAPAPTMKPSPPVLASPAVAARHPRVAPARAGVAGPTKFGKRPLGNGTPERPIDGRRSSRPCDSIGASTRSGRWRRTCGSGTTCDATGPAGGRLGARRSGSTTTDARRSRAPRR